MKYILFNQFFLYFVHFVNVSCTTIGVFENDRKVDALLSLSFSVM